MKRRRFRSRMWWVAGLSWAVAASSAFAQPAYLVADLQTQPTRDWTYPTSDPRIIEVEGVGYFFHDDGIHGSELWRTDGTALGTFLLRDLCPGLCGGRTLSGPERAAGLGGHLLFSGNDGVHGSELWITDGTAIGTVAVRDIRAGTDSSSPSQLVEAGGQIFFLADDGLHGRELWRSDGTPKGTYMVEDLTPGATGSYFPLLIFGGGHLLFTFYGDSNEPGLWVSDGTAAGTQRIAALGLPESGPYKGAPWRFLPNGLLLFAAAELGSSDAELWRSDGTTLGTYRLKDLLPGVEGSSPDTFMSYGNEIVFEAFPAAAAPARTFWRSDGSEIGTTEIPAPLDFSPYAQLGQYATVGDRIFFAAFEAAAGLELWVFDGIDVHRVSDIRPGPDSSIDYYAGGGFNHAPFADAGGRLVLLADDGVHGLEFWTSDGTEAGTTRISDLFPGTTAPEFGLYADLNPDTRLGDRFVLRSFDADAGHRLVASDGTAAGTGYLDTIGTASSSFLTRRDPAYPFGRTGSQCAEGTSQRLVFSTSSPLFVRDDFWGTDGSAAGTELLVPASVDSSNPGGCIALVNEVLFLAQHAAETALWASAGTSSSTAALFDVTPPVTTSSGELRPYFIPFGDAVAFGTAGGLWLSAGTAGATELVTPIADFSWGGLAMIDGSRIAYSDFELHISDGVPGGDLVEIDLNGIEPSYPSDLTALDPGRVLFVADTAGIGGELWTSDGTVEGTQLVREIRPGPRSYFEANRDDLSDAGPEAHIQSLGALAILTADDGNTGAELWVTDGSFVGTHLLSDIYPGDYPSTPRHLTRLGNRIVFSAEDEEHGLELWSTDGTAGGTALLKDIAPGLASSIPDDLVVRDGVLYFSAWSPNYGREAWKSDGTAVGTVRISDIAPGPLSSSPQRFARAGNRLYFSATDQIHGYELWAISDDGSIPLFLDGFESSDALLWSEVVP